MRRVQVAIVTSFLWLIAGVAWSDRGTGHVAFRHYAADDGLTALDVVVGLQDREGFIWAASPNGLFRYDGLRFVRFSVEDGLPSTLITDMAVAPDGVLWGATSRGLVFRRDHRFVAVGVDTLPVDGMHLLAFAEGRTWVTTDHGPFITGASGSEIALVEGWPGGPAFGIHVDPDGTMFVGSGTRLITRSRPGALWIDAGHDFAEKITSIVRDRAGRLWLRAGEHLWMQPSTGAGFVDRSSDYLGAPVGSDGNRLALSADGQLLIPTSIGLIEVDDLHARFVPTDLPDDARSIKAAWVDREGSLWLTSLGLHRELGRGLWRTVSTADGLPVNNVWSITGLADGRVAIGTDGGVAIFGGASPESLPVPSVSSLVEQPAGVLWIATTTKIVRHELTTGRELELGLDAGLPDKRISVLATDAGGTLWVGYSSGGLYRASTRGPPRFEAVAMPGGEGATISGIVARGDRLWVTSSRGLHVLDGGSWRRFTTADGLRDDGLMFLAARRNGEICVTYLAPYGLTCLRYAGGKVDHVRHLDTAKGLSSPVPYFLAEDNAGRLWVGGAQGVTIFEDDTVDYFTRAGGAPGDDCNANAIWVAPTGEVWIGTSSGAGVFATARYRGPPQPPQAHLMDACLSDNTLDLAAPKHDSVAYGSASLDVELAALSFIDERRVEVAVKLEGLDEDWHLAERHVASYPRLPPGSYRFLARARHRGGPWSAPTTFEFSVAAPFWRTIPFAIACGLGVLGLVVLVARWRSRALVRRNVELETLVRERTHDLVAANEKMAHVEKLSALGRLLAQLSHEINNPLNVIQNNMGPLEEYSRTLAAAAGECRTLVASHPELVPQLDEIWQRLELDYIIADGAEAFGVTNAAIERVSKIHHELEAFLRKEPIERTPTDLAAAVRSTTALVQRSLPGVEIRCELPPLPRVRANAKRFHQMLFNLIQNAADAMSRRGRIEIRAASVARGVELRVIDNGPGVPVELRSRIFEPFFSTKDVGKGLGLGLSICREIAVAHGGSLELDGDHAPGACFVIVLPV